VTKAIWFTSNFAAKEKGKQIEIG